MSLKALEGKGWVKAEPPGLESEPSVIAEVDGEEIKAGFERKDSPIEESKTCIHRKFRTGCYDVEVKITSGDGEVVMEGYIKVDRAEGYEQDSDD